jgi:hypothetical protein
VLSGSCPISVTRELYKLCLFLLDESLNPLLQCEHITLACQSSYEIRQLLGRRLDVVSMVLDLMDFAFE